MGHLSPISKHNKLSFTLTGFINSCCEKPVSARLGPGAHRSHSHSSSEQQETGSPSLASATISTLPFLLLEEAACRLTGCKLLISNKISSPKRKQCVYERDSHSLFLYHTLNTSLGKRKRESIQSS